MENGQLQKSIRKAAHDVRTPLTSIAGFAELLVEDASLTEMARENAVTILDEARRLSDILEAFFEEVSAAAHKN